MVLKMNEVVISQRMCMAKGEKSLPRRASKRNAATQALVLCATELSLQPPLIISAASNETWNLKDRVSQKLADGCDMSSFQYLDGFLNHCFTHHLFVYLFLDKRSCCCNPEYPGTCNTEQNYPQTLGILPASASTVLGLQVVPPCMTY